MKMFHTNDKFEKWEIWCDCRRFGNRWNNINIFHIHVSRFATFSIRIAWNNKTKTTTMHGFMNGVHREKKRAWTKMQYASRFLIRIHSVVSWKRNVTSSRFSLVRWYRAICNRVDQIEILFKIYSHCIRFAFYKLRMLFFACFSSLQFRIIYTNLAAKIMCASYELGEALIEKSICMLNSLFIHISRPANLNYKRIMKKKRKIWEPKFHICCVPIFCSFTKRNSFIGEYSRHGQHFIELLWWHQIGFSVFALHLYSIVVFSFFHTF